MMNIQLNTSHKLHLCKIPVIAILLSILLMSLGAKKASAQDRPLQLDEAIKSKIVLIILTSSMNPDDAEKAKHNPEVKGYKNKFLNGSQLDEILNCLFY